jgi:hypothetical protein
MEGGAERRLPSFGLCVLAYLAIAIGYDLANKYTDQAKIFIRDFFGSQFHIYRYQK